MSEDPFDSSIDKDSSDKSDADITSAIGKDLLRSIADSDNKEPNFDLQDYADTHKETIRLLNNPAEHLSKYSDLTEEQIQGLTILKTVSDFFGFSNSIGLFINSFLELQISKDRFGRRELFGVAESIQRLLSLDVMSSMDVPIDPSLMAGGSALAHEVPMLKKKSRWKFW